MPAVLTHKAIMLLARERLADIRARLTVKKNSGGQLTDVELRILHLADKAHTLLSRAMPVDADVTLGVGSLGAGVSRFAVMGSMGPDITGFSGVLANPAGKWVFDLVHKGTPDENREPVVARSTDLVLEMWREASRRIDARPADNDAQRAKKAEARDAVRAYLLGHLCHIAGDAICHPFIHDVEWHLGVGSRPKLDHGGGEMSIDARVATRVMGRAAVREGQGWGVWWPGKGDVPPELFAAYDAALETIYKARSDRPKGFGGFEAEQTEIGPLRLSEKFVRDGYSVLRGGAVNMVYGWGYGSWWLFLAPLALSVIAVGPLAAALPRGRRLTQEAIVEVDDERAWSEFLTLPMAATALVPVFYGTWIASLTTVGVEGITIFGQISAWINLALAGVFFGTLALDDVPWPVRWFLFFGLPMGTGVALAILGLTNLKHRKGALVLAMIYGAPAVIALLYGAVNQIVGLVGSGIGAGIGEAASDDAAGGADVGRAVGHWLTTGVVIVLAGVAWFLLPSKLRDVKLPERPEPFPAERRHFVRLFDDTTLFHHLPLAAAAAGDPATPTLAQRYFPAEARKLLVLWWEGGGDLFIRSRRTHLEFSLAAAGTDPQTVPGPLTPMTPKEFGDLLTRTVRDGASATGKLKTELAFAGDAALDLELPPGATFADEGDLLETVEGHDQAAARWIPVGKTKEAGYVLRHAPKALQAVRFSRVGPTAFDPRVEDEVAGAGTVRSERITLTGTGTDFRAFFTPGDRVRVAGQVRTVTLVPAGDRLVISAPLDPEAPAGTAYSRLGSSREVIDGYEFVSDPAAAKLGGETIMDYAADFSALLCMGATSHLLDRAELAVPDLAGKKGPGDGPVAETVEPVHQVFRNWSLDRRRVNEWRMLVAGGAVTEKRGDPRAYDSAMTTPPPAPGVPDPNYEERTILSQGWVPLMRRWIAMAEQPAQDASSPIQNGAGPGQPSNRDLSRAMAYLLDMPDPVAIH
ncbi:MAG: zinc dependent phospholipase C family protein [Longimicrobiaceae bacterium]